MIVHRLRAVMADSEMDDLIRHLRDEEDLTRIIEEVGDVDLPSRAIKKVAPRMGFAGIGMAKILLRHREIFK